jgi:cation diffusion facilitator CzcD-associated flavoprotein CzcO
MQPTHAPTPDSAHPRTVRTAIVGGGFSGIGVAARLLRRGDDDFVILERAEELGGTWRDNTYPGCACDVPSHLYSFSFAPKPDWTRVFAESAEIQDYLLGVARHEGVTSKAVTGCELIEARWDPAALRWDLLTTRGRWRCQVLVVAAGPLHEPLVPALPGLDTFEGTAFHSARWRHDHDLAGRRVAVVGTGSSAIQFVPMIQPRVAHLTVFQRTAPWVLPKPDVAIPLPVRALLRVAPPLRLAARGAIYALLEALQVAERHPEAMERLQRIGARHLERQVPDPALRAILRPRFTLGCKRLLLSNTWYPALQAPNARLVPRGVASLTPTGVVDTTGEHHAADTLIFGTGFHVTDLPIAERVVGLAGRTLAEVWAGSPQAYKGTTVPGFPNLFTMLGPNLGNGHTSLLLIVEAQARYLSDALATLDRAGLGAVEVRADALRAFNDEVQRALAGTVWNSGGCTSWYLDGSGVNRSIYPWTTLDLRRRLRRFDLAAYRTLPASAARPSASPPPA